MDLDEQLIETFERDGAVTVRGLLDDEWITSLRDNVDAMLERAYDARARLGSKRPAESQNVMSDGMWRDNDAFRTFLFESPIGETAASMMRSQSARLFEDLLLYGAAGADGKASWHQDEPGWPVTGRQLASVWFTLDGASSETGALRIVAGSHRGPMYRPRVSSKRADTIGDDWQHWSDEPLPDVEAAPEDYEIRVYETEPGDAVVFHPRALHTGKGSSPDHPRRTFTIRMLGDDIRWQPRSVLFHPWMAECGFEEGDVLDHPGFPVVWRSED
jgi:ectoine hydroxylase-related dioxygenase (phytanoyl-CoA dioxygenase family)